MVKSAPDPGVKNLDSTGAAGFLFAYGTLMFPEVRRRVLGREVRACAGYVSGFVRYRLRGLVYPGVVRGRGQVEGQWLGPLSAADWLRLDDFEDAFYQREPVRGKTSDGEAMRGELYLVGPQGEHLLELAEWDPAMMRHSVLSRWGLCP